jgi:hypothetical protein
MRPKAAADAIEDRMRLGAVLTLVNNAQSVDPATRETLFRQAKRSTTCRARPTAAPIGIRSCKSDLGSCHLDASRLYSKFSYKPSPRVLSNLREDLLT